MIDDIQAGGILLPDDIISTDGEFDPDAFESDDILGDDIAVTAIDGEIDPLIGDVV